MIKLPYALRNNKLVHINDIPLEQRGEKCGCYCPNCKEPVLARLGNAREHHFAHKGCFCDPHAAFETILHILSKDIIARASMFYLPRRDVGILRSELIDRDYIISDNFESWSSHHSIDSAEEFSEYVTGKVVKGGYKEVKSVTVEKSLDGIIPDIILNLDGIDVAVEIAVTHFVNFDKLAKVRSLKLPLLEIDLSNFYKYKDVEKNRVELEEILLDYSEAKKWVYFPRDEHEIERCIKRCFEIYDDNRRKQDEFIKLEAERVRKEEERKILEAKRNENSVRAAALKMIPDNYNEILEKHANCISDHVHWKSFIKKGLVKPDDWPSIIDIPIRGEIIFGCDRKIWQGAIYFYLIKDKKSVSPGFVLKCLMKWYDEIIIKEFFYTKHDYLKQNELPTSNEVILEYFRALMNARIIEYESYVKMNNWYAVIENSDIGQVKSVADYYRISPPALEQEQKRRQVTNNIDYLKHKVNMLPLIDNQQEIARDPDGNRWVKCRKCGRINIDAEFITYGGNDINSGICYECSKSEL